MTNQYEERANLAIRMLRVRDPCSDCYESARDAKKAHLFRTYAREAEEVMAAFESVADACAFYYDAMHKVGDALWWVEHNEYEARDRLVEFYQLLDTSGDEKSIFRRQ